MAAALRLIFFIRSLRDSFSSHRQGFMNRSFVTTAKAIKIKWLSLLPSVEETKLYAFFPYSQNDPQEKLQK